MQKTGQPTINDVARLAGVSKKTVSRVINRSPLLNDETRERVEDVIGELGYIPNPQARALALRRNFLIGLVHDNPNAQMVMNVQQGMLEALRGTEFEMVVRPVDRGSATMLDDLRHFLERQRLFGVVLLPPIIGERLGRAALRRDRLPLRPHGLGRARRCRTYGRIERSRGRVRGATDYLLAQGHRRIGLVAGPHGFRSARERRLGFEDALAAAGIALPRSLIADGNYTFEFGDRRRRAAARPHAAPDRDLRQQRRDGGGRDPCRAPAWARRSRATFRSSASTTRRSPRTSGRR